ncbi:hypothetical protein [Photobacterium nomapromontoriensis]|uniref:hypothetical protein n=1 Tax=Photobacterium nomapromontoriensis TaxID=2910237 RepID=UPI003D146BBF
MLFLIISVCALSLIVGIFVVQTKKNHHFLQSRFNQIIGLRQLIHLLRFHRRHAHQILTQDNNPTQSQPVIHAESMAIQALLQSLITQTDTSSKPMYRILQKRITTLLSDWPKYSLLRNQSSHGKAIRHVLYLIDDILTQSLLATDKQYLLHQYQTVWPITLNAIDSLSRFRYTIHNYTADSSAMEKELLLHTQILKRRLNQMVLSKSNAIPPLLIESLFAQFNEIDLKNSHGRQANRELYALSLQISDTLFNLFDNVLIDIANEVSVKLPSISPTENRVGSKLERI